MSRRKQTPKQLQRQQYTTRYIAEHSLDTNDYDACVILHDKQRIVIGTLPFGEEPNNQEYDNANLYDNVIIYNLNEREVPTTKDEAISMLNEASVMIKAHNQFVQTMSRRIAERLFDIMINLPESELIKALSQFESIPYNEKVKVNAWCERLAKMHGIDARSKLAKVRKGLFGASIKYTPIDILLMMVILTIDNQLSHTVEATTNSAVLHDVSELNSDMIALYNRIHDKHMGSVK